MWGKELCILILEVNQCQILQGLVGQEQGQDSAQGAWHQVQFLLHLTPSWELLYLDQ